MSNYLPQGDTIKPKIEQIRPAKKVLDVNASSLVDLKVELARKQKEYKLQRLNPQLGSRRPTKGPKFLQNKGVADRDKRDQYLTEDEKKDLDLSRRTLEKKAALYEKLKRSNVDLTDEASELYLVDFDQKAYDKRLDDRQRKNTPLDVKPACVATDGAPDDWIEYQDAFGRDRRCLRKDLPAKLAEVAAMRPENKSAPVELGFVKGSASYLGGPAPPPPPPGAPPTLLSEDMRRELERKQWEQDALDSLPEGPVIPTHFQSVVPGEIRQLGTGYFKFSNDEEERQAQLSELNSIRDETMEARKRSENLKKRRQEALEKRLNKIRKRKGQALVEKPDAEETPLMPTSNTAADGLAPARGPLLDAKTTEEVEEKVDDFLQYFKEQSKTSIIT